MKKTLLVFLLVLSFTLVFSASNNEKTYSMKSSFGGGVALLDVEAINSTFQEHDLPTINTPIFNMANSNSFILDNNLALIMDTNIFMNLSNENNNYKNRFVGTTFTGGVGYNLEFGTISLMPNFGMGIGSQIFLIQEKSVENVQNVLDNPGNSTILYSMEVPLKIGVDLGFNINKNRYTSINMVLKTDYFFNIANIGWTNNFVSMFPNFLENSAIDNKLEGFLISMMFEIDTDY
ncbi:hypothetical protein [Geotoga petraea]|jgi:hypothetical protein|uniref:Outer membrane protein beta-barrel domain-containing protein n=1 Tax=Geotoga petraea TaxID=28234 RepID=A0A1G6JPL3_9BACT|nr:hypothetical protein [Geotoga petraea]MDK2945426.1 hypothetical protein [Geotoga sp.]TGG88282.1 hypothetical protein E4650_04380 [Geotoga petraea]SDC20702.1 hypothetical protein SAMN04488588_0595 [Geotoga petraea]